MLLIAVGAVLAITGWMVNGWESIGLVMMVLGVSSLTGIIHRTVKPRRSGRGYKVLPSFNVA